MDRSCEQRPISDADLVAPSRPARTLRAGEEFKVGSANKGFDAVVLLVRLGAVGSAFENNCSTLLLIRLGEPRVNSHIAQPACVSSSRASDAG